MPSLDYIEWLECSITYPFKNRSFLEVALTAPGAEGNKEGTEKERDEHEGNRPFARLGRVLLQLVTVRATLPEEKLKRGMSADVAEST